MNEKIHLLVNTKVKLPPINKLNLWAFQLETDIYLSKYPTRKFGNIYRSIIDIPANYLPEYLPDFDRGCSVKDYHILRGEYVELDIETADHGEKIIVTYGTTREYAEKFPEELVAWHKLSSEEKYEQTCKFGDFLASLGKNDDYEDNYEDE